MTDTVHSPTPSATGWSAAGAARPGPAARVLLGGVWVYQHTLSPLLPALCGPAVCGCRFNPTCSHYAAGAVRTHGALAGTWLAARRLLKCTPLHPGGNDPVPARPGDQNVGGVPSPCEFEPMRGGGTPPTSEGA
jgi:hypothetical protein